MSKIIKTISVDGDVWAKAKLRTESISGTINFLLTRWVETEAEIYEKNKIETVKIELEQAKSAMAAMQQQLDAMKVEQNKRKVVRVLE